MHEFSDRASLAPVSSCLSPGCLFVLLVWSKCGLEKRPGWAEGPWEDGSCVLLRPENQISSHPAPNHCSIYLKKKHFLLYLEITLIAKQKLKFLVLDISL